jgi:hypothetical protein
MLRRVLPTVKNTDNYIYLVSNYILINYYMWYMKAHNNCKLTIYTQALLIHYCTTIDCKLSETVIIGLNVI